jgi:ATP/maltotriose-dependent transcriptional regulator MalT
MGQVDAAVSSVKRILQEAGDVLSRSLALPACIEVLIAAGEMEAARAAADELSEIASGFGSRFVTATALHASGAVSLAEGQPGAALAPLRKASAAWRDVDAPYHAATTAVFIGQACAALGDRDSAAVEWGAARQTFEQLGAAPDVRRVDALLGAEPDAPGGLTAREVDILRLVATGKTNRAISNELVISEKTVARHIANIFNKLDVSSRSAATAFAYEHGIVRRPA